MTAKINSEPTLSGFDPRVIPWQWDVVKLVRGGFDYSKDTLEILLSGSYGCLRENSRIWTADGLIPISDVSPQTHVLSHHAEKNQFVYQSCTGAFPKGKDYLYRVIHERGEFVATANHRIATLNGSYLPVSDFFGRNVSISSPLFQGQSCPSVRQLLSLSDVLHYWGKLANSVDHYVEHIRQYGPQLLPVVSSVLALFPLQHDARESGQFFCYHSNAHKDDFQALESECGHIFELHAHQSMRDFLRLMGDGVSGEACLYTDSKSFAHTLFCTLDQSLFQLRSDLHPKAVLFFLLKLTSFLSRIFNVEPLKQGITESAILAIEKLDKKEWYWDMQVPNTNNYISEGAIHHNSAKSTLMAHLAVTHCLLYPGARVCLARRALPDLKRTILREILDHIDDHPDIAKHNRSDSTIKFENGSEIICMTWADKRYKKGRSLNISMLVIEEIVENDLEDKEAFDTLRARLRRLPHVKENLLIAATNPDSPGHWVYKHWIDRAAQEKFPNRKVFYSLTEQNPFLDAVYIRGLRESMSQKEADRYLRGQWNDLRSSFIYYAYTKQNFINQSYKVDEQYPVCISFDFNIAEGKPLSSVFFQFINGKMHIFNEVVIDGFRTRDNLSEALERGLLSYNTKYFVHGDAAGKSMDTRSKKSDYDIIKDFLSNETKLNFQVQVPLANPPIRKRHNLVNAYCCNDLGERSLFVYKDAPTADEGLRLAKLVNDSDYKENDKDRFQHISTAIGYGLHRQHQNLNTKRLESGTM